MRRKHRRKDVLQEKLRERNLRNFLNDRDLEDVSDILRKHKRVRRDDIDLDPDFEDLCDKFGDILDADASVTNGVCLAQRLRNELNVEILGRETTSPLVLPQFFSFENLDFKGNALNLGETVILQKEIKPFMKALVDQDIRVTALHNHWLFEEPRLLYMHFESVEPPLDFARKVAKALKLLG